MADACHLEYAYKSEAQLGDIIHMVQPHGGCDDVLPVITELDKNIPSITVGSDTGFDRQPGN